MSTEQGTDTTAEDDTRPRPTPQGHDAADRGNGTSADGSGNGTSADSGDGTSADGGDGTLSYGEDETQDFVDRSKIDFDPADGLYTGSAVTGDSDIPGPSESDIREAQEGLGDDQDGDDGAKAAAEKFIEENDVDLEEAKKGEAIAGSAQSSGDKADDA